MSTTEKIFYAKKFFPRLGLTDAIACIDAILANRRPEPSAPAKSPARRP
jgi:hypothetical protein